MNLALSSAFQAWRQHYEAQIEKRALLKKALAAFVRKTELKVWITWKESVARHQLNGEKLFRAIVLWENTLLFKSVNSWFAFASEQKLQRAKIECLLKRWNSNHLNGALNQWKAFLLSRRQQRERHEQAEFYHNGRLLKTSINQWQEMLQTSRNLFSKAVDFFAGISARSVESCFTEWSQLVRLKASRNQKLAGALVQHLLSKQRLSFLHWNQALHHSRDIKSKLRTCIKRWESRTAIAALSAFRCVI